VVVNVSGRPVIVETKVLTIVLVIVACGGTEVEMIVLVKVNGFPVMVEI
jgi:hypothetical protein